MLPDVPLGSEHALRLLTTPDQFQKDRVTSAAFHVKGPISLFLRERLPDSTGDCLHVGKFANAGRACAEVDALRKIEFESEKTIIRPFDVELSPDDALDVLTPLAAAHCTLLGHVSTGGAKALARLFSAAIDRKPSWAKK